jgi:hypothetical protein
MIDIATRFLPAQHKIWILHPGSGKRQLKIFANESVVFLEIPGFSPTEFTFSDVKLIRRHLRMANAIRKYARNSNENSPPSRNFLHYDDELGDRSFNSSVSNIRSLYGEANKGDLIIVPSYGQYNNVLAGELTKDFNTDDYLYVNPLQDELTPVRPVKWMPRTFQRREISEDLSCLMSNRHAIIRIKKKRACA